ncbi:MAG TPA: hypothetical protein VIH57_00290 [Bacteroidales bacterium]
MTITYQIQKVDFFVDQIEDKGQIDLEDAISVFQNFPFEDQLRQASDRELTSCLPSITFVSSLGASLKIFAQDTNGFFLHYDNGIKEADFYLSNDYNRNPEGLNVEEFIEQFFNGNIEQSLKLVDRQEESDNDQLIQSGKKHFVTYSYKQNNFKYYLWTVPFLIFSLIVLAIFHFKNLENEWGVTLLSSVLWLPGTIVHLTYWIKNKNTIVKIDTHQKTIEYEQNGYMIKFNRNEISKCELNISRSLQAPWSSYRYLLIILKDRRKIIITNFIIDPEDVIGLLKLNYRIDRRAVPFLPI